ncbi:hypothetical protein [Aquimarina longa]|uniref:hypothetical protein n=1 Tax=Aquimarina longa TaxID=1080221 RepID=UPI000781B1F6|nr:hypothetical protein [Aquimarina longa]
MKKNILLLCFIFCINLYSQIDSNSLFALPKATTLEIKGISSPLEGSLVYSSTDRHIYKYTGSVWVPFDGSETNIIAGDNINITGTGTTSDPYIINAVPATLVLNPDGTYTFSNGVDPDVIITRGGAGHAPIVSQSNATGNCNDFQTNETRDIIITGDFFDGSSVVTISGQVVNSIIVNSVNQIIANVTAGTVSGSYDIQVTTGAGTGTLANGFVIKTGLISHNYATGDITLSSRMSYIAGNLDRTSGNSWNEQGYSLIYGIPLGNEGHLNFTAGGGINRYRMIGLNSDPASNSHYNSLDYAIYLTGYRLNIYENGIHRGDYGTYTFGDQFEINVNCNGIVTYKKNGTVFYTSSVAVSSILYLDSSFYSFNAEVYNISISY